MDAQAPLGWVVVGRDDGDARHVRVLRGHAVDGERAGFPRTDDERPRAIDVIPRERALLTALDAPQQTVAAHKEDEQNRRADEHANREPHVDNPQEHGAYQGRYNHGKHDLERLVDACVFP